jgi:hypothetical protein
VLDDEDDILMQEVEGGRILISLVELDSAVKWRQIGACLAPKKCHYPSGWNSDKVNYFLSYF